MVPQYVFKVLEEVARGVAVAFIVYAGAAVAENGLPDSRETLVAFLVGALPVVYAAVRTVLNKTPLTPDANSGQEGGN